MHAPPPDINKYTFKNPPEKSDVWHFLGGEWSWAVFPSQTVVCDAMKKGTVIYIPSELCYLWIGEGSCSLK